MKIKKFLSRAKDLSAPL